MEGSGVAFPERVDRLLGEYGVQADTPAGRRHFMEATEARRQSQRGLGKQRDLFWRKWRFGADDFAELLASKLGRRGEPDESPPAREELDAVRAERLVREALKSEGWSEKDLRGTPKGRPVKVRIAAQLRRETPMKHAGKQRAAGESELPGRGEARIGRYRSYLRSR